MWFLADLTWSLAH